MQPICLANRATYLDRALLYRNAQGRAQAAERTRRELDVAAMRARHVARDREAQPRAGLVLIARLVESEERLENVLAPIGRNARPVIVNVDCQEAPIVRSLDNDFACVMLRVDHKIGDTTLERVRPHRDDRIPAERRLDIVTFVSELVLHLLQ